MIIDLPRFVAAERAYWDELDAALKAIEDNPELRLPLSEIERLHYLYERCSADLAQLDTFATEPRLRAYLESLTSRTYAEIHETRTPAKLRIWSVILMFPRAFRRHVAAFALSLAATIAGLALGGFAMVRDPQAKAVLMPFPNLMTSPAKRVKQEESAQTDRLQGKKSAFAAELMTHNIQVAVMAMAWGMTWGVGTLITLFYNGLILGAVCADYLSANRACFWPDGCCRTAPLRFRRS